MWLVYFGLAVLAAWYFELGFFADMSGFWTAVWIDVITPFALALLWFEWGEGASGWDKRTLRKKADAEQARQERIRRQFFEKNTPGRVR
ncbi:MAG: TIGR04438 family Trp-rich protein [Burkholderiaceae bacterium]